MFFQNENDWPDPVPTPPKPTVSIPINLLPKFLPQNAKTYTIDGKEVTAQPRATQPNSLNPWQDEKPVNLDQFNQDLIPLLGPFNFPKLPPNVLPK